MDPTPRQQRPWLCARRHLDLAETRALLLGGTGPVGQRAAELLAGAGAHVRLASRSLERAEQVCERIAATVENAHLVPCRINNADELQAALADTTLIIAAGAAGVQFLSSAEWQNCSSLKVAIDLNAVPPAGLEGIEVFDKAENRSDVLCYGAIGVGGLKMKIHKAAIKTLFTRNDLSLDTAAIYDIGEDLERD